MKVGRVIPLLALVLATPIPVGAQAHGRGREEQKVAICHYPPGNPANAHTLMLPEPAVQAHLRHGDTSGACSELVGRNKAKGRPPKGGGDDEKTDENTTDEKKTDENKTNEKKQEVTPSPVPTPDPVP